MSCCTNKEVIVKFSKIDQNAVMPKYAKLGDAGFDFYALENQVIPGNARGALIKTGLKVWLPNGYELQVRDRSGMCVKTSVRVANAPGTIDEGYTGEICLIMDNLSNKDFVIDTDNRRIAQGVIKKVPKITMLEITSEEMDKRVTERGATGFGDSGRG